MSENVIQTPSQPPPEPLHQRNLNIDQPTHSESKKEPAQSTPTVLFNALDEKTVCIARDIPHVQLEHTSISPAMAARLADSLLAHILFLKSQIPL